LEFAAIQDVLVVGEVLDKEKSRERKVELDRIAAMLSRLGGRGYCVQENPEPYGQAEFDPDPDSDFDFDEIKAQQMERTVDSTYFFIERARPARSGKLYLYNLSNSLRYSFEISSLSIIKIFSSFFLFALFE